MPPVGFELAVAPTNEPDRYGGETRNSSIRGSIRPVARGAERVSDPDEFSAPTGMEKTERTAADLDRSRRNVAFVVAVKR
jgi:hypothetical protein